MTRTDLIFNISRMRTDNSMSTTQSLLSAFVWYRVLDDVFEVSTKGGATIGASRNPEGAADIILGYEHSLLVA